MCFSGYMVNFKIGTVCRKIFYFVNSFYMGLIYRKTVWKNGEIPTKSFKIFRVGVEKLGMAG